MQVTGLQGQTHLNGVTGILLEFEPAKDRWQVRLDNSTEVKLLKATNLTPLGLIPQALPAPGLLDYQQLQQQHEAFALAEDLELQRAMQASLEADEEKQLLWALEESTRLAEAERQAEAKASEAALREEQQASTKKVPSDSSQSTAPPARGAAAVTPWESDDEGRAWDSAGEDADADAARGGGGGSDDDDEELPPLELLPNSEE